MYSKRNIKKKCENKSEAKVPEQSNVQKVIIFGKYTYPTYDRVPAGYYHSTVVSAREAKTYRGEDALEIVYVIISQPVCYKIAIGELPEDTSEGTYYIKQKYPLNSDAYEALEASIYEKFGHTNYTPTDLIDLQESVTLSYSSRASEYGGFSQRTLYDWDDYLYALRQLHESRKADYDECYEDTYANDNASDEESDEFMDDYNPFDW